MHIIRLCVSMFTACIGCVFYCVLPCIPLHSVIADIGYNGHPVPPYLSTITKVYCLYVYMKIARNWTKDRVRYPARPTGELMDKMNKSCPWKRHAGLSSQVGNARERLPLLRYCLRRKVDVCEEWTYTKGAGIAQ
jgi:hypothetical protein